MNGLLVGRFQPFHLGHVFAIQDALKSCEKLWLCIGSTNVQLNFKNPFSVSERREMIESSIGRAALCKHRREFVCEFYDHKSLRYHNGYNV